MFYIHYPYAGETVTTNSAGVSVSPKFKRINPPISKDSKEFHKRFKHQPSLISEIINSTSVSSIEEIDEGLIIGNSVAPIGSTSSDPTLSPRAQCKCQFYVIRVLLNVKCNIDFTLQCRLLQRILFQTVALKLPKQTINLC